MKELSTGDERAITKAAGDTQAPGCRLKHVIAVTCHLSIALFQPYHFLSEYSDLIRSTN